MKYASLQLLLTIALITWHIDGVNGNAGVFTYFDDEFTAPGSSTILQVGPASWKKLLIPNNQCGGDVGQSTGYGQSPIVIPQSSADQCDTDLSGYEFKGGSCPFDQLHFRIVTNGVIVGPKFDSDCSLGRMKIPGSDSWFNALQFHIHTSSEHSVNGKYYPAELHVVHQEENQQSFAVFGMFIGKHEGSSGDTGTASDNDNPVFEHYLQGWEAVRTQTEELCAAKPKGTGQFSPNRLFTSKQQLLQCPSVSSSVSPNDIDNFVWTDETVQLPQTPGATQTTRLPQLKNPDYPSGPIPKIYTSLQTNSEAGIYTYRGGLTTPPCTEIVRWNLLDTPMMISSKQLDRLYELILCFTERSTCRHATVASIFGTTNRPPQPLLGRNVLHRCSDGPSPQDSRVMLDPIPPVVKTSTQPKRRNIQTWQAVLYPWFIMILGVVTFYLLSRYIHILPYTAVMFILGTLMGIGITVLQNTDHLSTSTTMWSNINSELLFLVFLPGLIFRDAFSLNVYLLKDALLQCIIMAFPMVLAGTSLLALVGYYILPYGWSFSLSMTFGAILSATDPVAVSALLNEVGAPPRLKTHISGESLLNDGSAMVFYTIFASMFLFEQGIPGLGRDIDVGIGFKLFFQMSLGAVAIGLAFGIGLVRLLFLFNRRFQAEESVVQVTATISVAYLCYYVAEAVCRTSGVLSVVTCGVVTKAFGYNMINDPIMMEKFWVLVEHLLNTLLFALGGVVWGTVISNSSSIRSEEFTGKDWGYLVLVYILMMAVRLFLFTVAFPVIGHIGLKSSWREVVFMSFGGLRGAVGIALAVALDNELRRDTVPGDPRRSYTSQLFGLTGGVALLTLLINGTLCGPLLRKLGLADSTEAREKIVMQYRQHATEHVLDTLLQKLSDSRFENVDFETIQRHVPSLRSITANDIKTAVKRHKANTPVHEYKQPNLDTFWPILNKASLQEIQSLARVSSSAKLKSLVMRTSISSVSLEAMNEKMDNEPVTEEKLLELRKIFVQLLRCAYNRQIEGGEVEVRKGLVVFTLENSLEYTDDAISEGKQLCDWDMLQKISNPWTNRTKDILDMPVREELQRMSSSVRFRRDKSFLRNDGFVSMETKKIATSAQRAVAFIEAHQIAQKTFKDDFTKNRFLSNAERQILDESRAQVSKAEELLQSIQPSELKNVISHLLCTILLNKTASFIGNLISQGLLKEQEGEDYMHELVEYELHQVNVCVSKKCCNQSDKIIDKSITNESIPQINDVEPGIFCAETIEERDEKVVDNIQEDTEDNDSGSTEDPGGITF